jgi:hypothetical protein
MASKKTLNLDNLAALGPERLAAILVDLAAGNAEIRRRLRLELAAQAGGGDALAAEVGKRLTALRTARSFVDWQKRREFLKDLDQQRVMIVDRIAQTRPDLALDLMWQFMDLAEPVFNRVDDSNGSVGDVFHTACDNLATIALMARPDPASLADRVFTALSKNDYGLFDHLVKVIFPALGETGVARLRTRLTEALTSRPRGADKRDRHADAFGRALQAMADSEGDVDAYIALIPVEDLDRPYIGAAVGRRLLAAGRANEALAALERSKPKRQADRARQYDELYELGYLRGHDDVWDEVYIDALDATGHGERAQQLRRAAFEERLSSENLRAYLKKLPDFEDVEAEDWAMRHALGFRNFSAALYFFHQWPDRGQAPPGRDPAATGHDRRHAGGCEIVPLQACRPAPSRMPIPGDDDPGLWHVRNRRGIHQSPSRQPRSKDRFLETGCRGVRNAALIKFGHFAQLCGHGAFMESMQKRGRLR